MTATATKPRKAAKNKPSAMRTVEAIMPELEAARKKLADYDGWDNEKKEKLQEAATLIEAELEVAQVKSMPSADPLLPKASDGDISIDVIVVTGNHREGDDEGADIARLARSLSDVGLQQRIGVRQMGGGKYELIWGSRRRRAAIMAEWKSIPARVFPKETSPDQVELLRDIENFNRKSLTPVERAIAVARTIETVEKSATPKTAEGRTQLKRIESAGGVEAYVGLLLGYPASWVRDNAYVSKLGGDARTLLADRRITIEHARELAKLGDRQSADDLADQCAKRADGTGGESVQWLRNRIAEELLSLKSVPWRLDATFPKKGHCLGVACEACPFNSKSDPKLFEHDVPANGDGDVAGLSAAGVCRNAPCFESKKRMTEQVIEAGLAKVQTAVKKSEEAITLTEKGLSDFIPVTVRGGTFARKAKAQINPETGGRAKPKPRGQQSEEKPKSPQQLARERYVKALETWQATAGKKVMDKINADPLRKIYLFLLDRVGVLSSLRDHSSAYTYYHDEKQVAQLCKSDDAKNAKARKLVTAGALKSLVKRMAEPKVSDLISLGKQMHKVDDREIGDLVDAAVQAFAAAVGVEVAQPPQLDTFIKEETEKVKAADAGDKDAEKLKASQRTAHEEAAREAGEIEDDEELEDEGDDE